jgi:hypothetical protein
MGRSSFIGEVRRWSQKVVLYKIPAAMGQHVETQELLKKLRCSLQGRPLLAQLAKPLRRNALGPELGCSLQGL